MEKNVPFRFEATSAVDETALAKLFDQLRVETNGKLVHPQWKHFRHMKMIRDDRTRLSNAIWRSWFIQTKLDKKPLFCQFHVDVSLQEHQVPQAVPIEGKYWKRRSDAVATEYKKWRLYYKQKRMFNQRRVLQGTLATGATDGATSVDMENTETTIPANTIGTAAPGYYFYGDEFQDIPDNLLSAQLPYLFSDRITMDTADTIQPSLANLNPNPFINELDHSWMDFQLTTGKDQLFPSNVPHYFKSSPHRVPFMNDNPVSYGELLLEQYDQQNKRDAELQSSNGQIGGAVMVKTEVPISSEPKDVQYIPRNNSNTALPQAAAPPSATPTIQHSQSFPTMRHYADNTPMPIFQGLLDPKAQYHKTLAENSRLEQAQRKHQEEVNKQQQLYLSLLQQYSNQLPESTRPQAEMLQALLTDPNMVNVLQQVFKPQQSTQEPCSTPSINTSLPPSDHTPPPLSAPPNFSPVASPPVNTPHQSFQYQSSQPNSSKELNLTDADILTIEDSRPVKPITPEERKLYKEVRRQSHITAEQKRRGHIKAGLDQLQVLISRVDPSSQNQSKMSKANVLMKSVDYVEKMHSRREAVDSEIALLQEQVKQLNNSINRLQEQLPASGAASGMSGRQYQENQRRFTQYVCERSTQNYRFWIFSLMAQSLFDSYNSVVSTSNMDEFCRTALAWNSQQCSLAALRPAVQDGLRKISQTTSILTEPNRLPQQLIELIQEERGKLQGAMDSTT